MARRTFMFKHIGLASTATDVGAERCALGFDGRFVWRSPRNASARRANVILQEPPAVAHSAPP